MKRPEADRPDAGGEDRPGGARPSRRRRAVRRPKRMILKSTALLPALFTLSNGLFGFAAIHYATKYTPSADGAVGHLSLAAWLVFAAMVCDMLDGRVARMTRRTTDFGGQLDSICDVISFGVAPPAIVLRTITTILRQMEAVPHALALERIIWCIAAVYVACAALRLARFNVENVPDESAHMHFSGLPSPGAAAAVSALVILFASLTGKIGSPDWLLVSACVVLPVVMLATALLMVSRWSYPHVINQYIRGKRPFGYLVRLVIIIPVALWQPFVTLAVFATAYAVSAPAKVLWQRARQHRPPARQTEGS